MCVAEVAEGRRRRTLHSCGRRRMGPTERRCHAAKAGARRRSPTQPPFDCRLVVLPGTHCCRP
eukprot:3641746-Lingulodinium_polyedra.AAC.1